jgi:hypothetical protein
MNTISFPYTLSDKSQILALMKNQNNVVRFIYNRLQENKDLTQKQLTILANSMNNIFIDSWLKQSAIYKAKEKIKHSRKIISFNINASTHMRMIKTGPGQYQGILPGISNKIDDFPFLSPQIID